MKLNKKGFTLIELLAVIVILGLLIAIAIPSVSRFLNSARQGAFVDNALSAIEAVRADILISGQVGEKTYNLNGTCTGATADNSADCVNNNGTWEKGINDLLEKKLIKSPYGNDYTNGKIVASFDIVTGVYTYGICLADGNYYIKGVEGSLSELNIRTDANHNCLSANVFDNND